MSDGRFLSRLVVAPVDGREGQWEVMLPLIYLDAGCNAYTVPAGTVTDLASIPRVFQRLFPVNGVHRPAAVLHDYLYQCQGKIGRHTLTRAETDALFQQAMIACGVGRFMARTFYAAVRVGGWAAWR